MNVTTINKVRDMENLDLIKLFLGTTDEAPEHYRYWED